MILWIEQSVWSRAWFLLLNYCYLWNIYVGGGNVPYLKVIVVNWIVTEIFNWHFPKDWVIISDLPSLTNQKVSYVKIKECSIWCGRHRTLPKKIPGIQVWHNWAFFFTRKILYWIMVTALNNKAKFPYGSWISPHMDWSIFW